MPPALRLLRQYRRSDGTGELGFGRNFYFLASFCFQCFYHADVFGDPARHHDWRFKADPIGHGDDSGGDGFMDAGNNVFSFLTLRNERYDF